MILIPFLSLIYMNTFGVHIEMRLGVLRRIIAALIELLADHAALKHAGGS
jgi:hypothetical protein